MKYPALEKILSEVNDMEAQAIVDSYVNGQFKQMVSQMDETGNIADVIDQAIVLAGPDQTLDMLKKYFSIKGL